VKNAWSYTSTPQYVSWHGAQLKHKDNNTFIFPFLNNVPSFVINYSSLSFLWGRGLFFVGPSHNPMALSRVADGE